MKKKMKDFQSDAIDPTKIIGGKCIYSGSEILSIKLVPPRPPCPRVTSGSLFFS